MLFVWQGDFLWRWDSSNQKERKNEAILTEGPKESLDWENIEEAEGGDMTRF